MKNLFSKIKDKITRERYTTSFRLKVLIIVCWVVYIACLIIKLCGGNRFEIATSNETFIAICDYIDNTLWLKITIYACISLIMNTLLALAMMKQKFYTVKQICIFVPLILTMSIISWYSVIAQYILNFVFCILIILFHPKQWYRVLIGVILLFIFQFISIFTRNIGGININDEKSFVAIILQIDMIVMLVIYYLLANARKEIS
jgi:hypothetical protein